VRLGLCEHIEARTAGAGWVLLPPKDGNLGEIAVAVGFAGNEVLVKMV
jgi:hypothetical protein